MLFHLADTRQQKLHVALKSSADTWKASSSERGSPSGLLGSFLSSSPLTSCEANDLCIMHPFSLRHRLLLEESSHAPQRFCGTPGPLTQRSPHHSHPSSSSRIVFQIPSFLRHASLCLLFFLLNSFYINQKQFLQHMATRKSVLYSLKNKRDVTHLSYFVTRRDGLP